jgi:hypothetical protein
MVDSTQGIPEQMDKLEASITFYIIFWCSLLVVKQMMAFTHLHTWVDVLFISDLTVWHWFCSVLLLIRLC